MWAGLCRICSSESDRFHLAWCPSVIRCCSRWAGFPVALSSMNTPHFSLPIHLLTDMRLFPYPGYWEWCCYECWCTNICSRACCKHLGHIPRTWVARSHGASMFKFWGVTYRFARCLHHSMFPPSMHKCPNFSISSPTFVYSVFFFCFVLFCFFASNPNQCKVVFHCGLDFIALMVSDIEYCFMCLLAICVIYLLWRNVCSSPLLI